MKDAVALTLAVACALSGAALPARAAGCDSPQRGQFNFWLGDWRIEQHITGPDGETVTLPARTSVSRAAGGCAIVERWSGKVLFPWAGMTEPAPMDGLSVRYFNADEDRWYIHWLDSRNPVFGKPFVGGFEGGVGRFFLTRDTEEGPRQSRITFRQPGADQVRWELAIENAEGNWTTFWVMDMRRQ